MVLGSREIINFNIALFVGFIAGVYSSIYISNQIWLMLEIKSIKKPKKDDIDDDELNELEIKGVNC
jgi:SecD/SecF fusion protein